MDALTANHIATVVAPGSPVAWLGPLDAATEADVVRLVAAHHVRETWLEPQAHLTLLVEGTPDRAVVARLAQLTAELASQRVWVVARATDDPGLVAAVAAVAAPCLRGPVPDVGAVVLAEWLQDRARRPTGVAS